MRAYHRTSVENKHDNLDEPQFGFLRRWKLLQLLKTRDLPAMSTFGGGQARPLFRVTGYYFVFPARTSFDTIVRSDKLEVIACL